MTESHSLTAAYVLGRFRKFNTEIFGGRLPEVPVIISDARTFSGLLSYRNRPDIGGSAGAFDFKLRISGILNEPGDALDDVVLHEMIHLFIAFTGLKDTSPHGHIFKGMMKAINEVYGRGITVSRRLVDCERKVASVKEKGWHVVATVALSDGSKGIKVLPKNVKSISAFNNLLARGDSLATVRYFYTRDPYFQTFPVSSAPRIFRVSEPKLDRLMQEGVEVLVEDGSIRRKGI